MGERARRRAVVVVAVGALLAGATGFPPRPASGQAPVPADPAVVPPAVVPGADWQVDTPESHGMDPAQLDQARAYAMADGRNTQAVLVVHRGAIVAEWYAPDADRHRPATSWSVAKSFTGSLIGLAIDDGLIPSIDEPMTTYFPDWIGTPKAAITIRDVLHMESGLQFLEDESIGGGPDSDIIQMVLTQRDQLAFAASHPLEVAPGTRWSYSSGDSMLLSGVIQQATGMSAGEYARKKLFDPIGMGPVDWWRDAFGHSLTYCCIDTTPRDFARFGLLYLDGGTWGSKQVVPSSWVHDTFTDTANSNAGYGYQWFLDAGGSAGLPPRYTAIGFDGQAIVLIPSLDLEVVRFGTYVKSPCPAIADPNLIGYLPPLGIVPGAGTVPPDDFSANDFLKLIVDSFTSGGTNAAGGNAAGTSTGDGSAATPATTADRSTRAAPPRCPNVPTTTTTTTPVPAAVGPAAAVPVAATPAYTG